MSLVGDIIKDVARKGEITHEFTVGELEFVIAPLDTENQIIADGMINSENLRTKYGAENLLTLNDTVQKYRTLAKVALATKTLNGKSPVDPEANLKDQYKQREEFRDELMTLKTGMIDYIIEQYNQLAVKERKFYSDMKTNVEKS